MKKLELYRLINNNLKKIMDYGFFDYQELATILEINDTLNGMTLSAALDDIKSRYKVISRKRNNRNIYQITEPQFIFTGEVEKNKNLLFFKAENDKIVTFDFNKKIFLTDFDLMLCGGITHILSIFIQENIGDMEWAFNYCDSIHVLRDLKRRMTANNHDYSKMPKDFYTFIKSKEEDDTLLTIYSKYLEYDFTQGDKFLSSIYNLIDKNKLNIVKELFPNKKKITDMFKHSIMQGELEIKADFKELIDYANYLNNVYDYKLLIDYEKTLATNLKIFKNYYEEEENKILEKQLQKLNFINNLVIEDYIVIVPQTQKDKVKEGRVQHNCVGYHYDFSIKRGENFIYFLRKKDTPDTSYMTCRFNKAIKITSEYKYKNNTFVSDRKEIEILKQIDEIILSHIDEL